MKPSRPVSRRSFLATVAGSAVTGGALLTVHGRAGAGQVTDSDPGDPVGHGRGGGTGVTDGDPSDPVGRGRGGGATDSGTGVTDGDPSDPVGRGRGGSGGTRSGFTDRDPTDPIGRGRGGGGTASGCSDRDPTDPGGGGRNCGTTHGGGGGGGGGGEAYPTGRRERRYEVCWVDHPSRTNEECNLQTYSEWAVTYSDGRIEYETAESAQRRAEMEARGYTARWHRMLVNEW